MPDPDLRTRFERVLEIPAAKPEPKPCSSCKHVHRGETRETNADQCGFPWVGEQTPEEKRAGRASSSFGWCQCYGESK